MSLNTSDRHSGGCLSLGRLFKFKPERTPKSSSKQPNLSRRHDQMHEPSDSETNIDTVRFVTQSFCATCFSVPHRPIGHVAYFMIHVVTLRAAKPILRHTNGRLPLFIQTWLAVIPFTVKSGTPSTAWSMTSIRPYDL